MYLVIYQLKKDWFSRIEFDSFWDNLRSIRNETGSIKHSKSLHTIFFKGYPNNEENHTYTCNIITFSGYEPSNEEIELVTVDELNDGTEVEEVDDPVEADNVNKNEREIYKGM